jgi:hypothetical protein
MKMKFLKVEANEKNVNIALLDGEGRKHFYFEQIHES